jgi:phosphate-selective porin OprO/OprP
MRNNSFPTIITQKTNMKRYIFLPVLAACFMASSAQDFDTKPSVSIRNEKEDMHFTVGARMMADVAYYHSDYTPLKSGASLTDARIRTSMTYKDWYFYADFGFGEGKFSQKNIFMQYTWKNANSIKAGYYVDPTSMARNISIGSYHFISRPGSVNALSEGRQLGITYKYQDKTWFANQGVFADNAYNNQPVGYNGVSVAGRWLYRPLNDRRETFHFGVNGRFSHLSGGEVYKNVMKKTLNFGQSLETYVDDTEDFINVSLPWANNVVNLGAEFLYTNPDFFVRGEYLYKMVTKKRDSYSLFIDAQDNIDGWGAYDAWLTANPLRTNHFHGAYVEAGYKIFGPSYRYNNAEGILGGLDGKALEVVARFNYTGLNDIVSGEYYSLGRDQYYPSGYIEDWPYNSSSVGGGNIYSATVGINYSFNNYVKVLCDYTYSRIDRDKLPYDKNVHALQGRLIVTF